MWKTILIVAAVGVLGCAVWAYSAGGGRAWVPVIVAALFGMLINAAWRRIR